MGKKILVVGANFKDKGSQSKLFVVTDELKKRLGDCQIFFASDGDQYNESDYIFKKISYTRQYQDIALGGKGKLLSNLTQLIRKKDDSPSNSSDVQKLFSQIDLIIDINDFVLGDKSTKAEHEAYLNNIRIAKKYGIPIIIMPQSFGPFNYSMDNAELIQEMLDLLFYPKAIFTREEEGYDELMGNFGLDNLRKSSDLVLENKDLNITNVCSPSYTPNIPDIQPGDNVAIIPNNHYFTKKLANQNYALYFRIIEKLLDAGKAIYVFCFSSSDLEACRKIVSMFGYNNRITLIEQEFDCIEYDFIIKYFDFIVCSRYHGCVHAYKNHIPGLVLGSTVRYKELAKIMNQEKYYFDILSDGFNDKDWLYAINCLLDHGDEEKEIIRTRLEEIQSHNCLDVIDELGW